MKIVLAFDVYGTLIDTGGVVTRLHKLIGKQADDFSRIWREKQLEYSFRRGLMRKYESFAVCTRDALRYTSAQLGTAFGPRDEAALLGAYRTLPAFAEVGDSLAALGTGPFALYAFSNGTANAVEDLLSAAKIRNYFEGIVSVDDLQTFKPNPDVYQHFMRISGAESQNAWLISGNPFDVIGAMSAGMQGAWVRRSPATVFDPWGIEPTITVTDLAGIGDRIAEYRASA